MAADRLASLPILQHCAHDVSRQSMGLIEHGGPVLIDSIRARAMGADPEGTCLVLDDGADPNVVLTLGGSNVLKRSVDVTAKPAVRSHPHATTAARDNGPRHVALQSFGLARGNKFAVSESQQALVAAADPETAFVILEQCAQLARGKLIGAQAAEISIAPTHEADPMGRDPQISVVIAGYAPAPATHARGPRPQGKAPFPAAGK